MGKRKSESKITGEPEVQHEVEQVKEEVVKAPKGRGPRGVGEDAVITVLAGANPKRDGSRAHALWGLYQSGMTVKQYADAVDAAGHAGESTAALVYDTKHGFVAIEGYDPGAIIEAKPKAEPKPRKERKAKGEEAVAADVAAVQESNTERLE